MAPDPVLVDRWIRGSTRIRNSDLDALAVALDGVLAKKKHAMETMETMERLKIYPVIKYVKHMLNCPELFLN